MSMTNGTSASWNGPTCATCGVRWLGSHTCSHDDIVRKINELLALLAPQPVQRNGLNLDPTQACPCRPENGGSGVCGCILGGCRVTC